MAVQGAPPGRPRRRVPRGDARGPAARGRPRRHGRSTTRTAGSGRCGSGSGSSSAGSLSLRVWQSLPAELRRTRCAALGIAAGPRAARCLRLGYLKVFMDGTLGSQTALDARRLRRPDHERRRARRDRRAAAPRPGSRSRCTRSATAPTARRSTRSSETRDVWAPLGLRHRIEHAQLLAADDLPRFAELGVACSVQFSHAPSDRDLADRFWAGKDGRRLRLPVARRLGRRRRERLRRADRGARPARRDPGRRAPDDRRAPGLASRAGPDGAAGVRGDARRARPGSRGDERWRGRLLPGYAADLVVLDRDPWHDLDAEVVATMVAGRWVHNPPPWD